MNVLFISFSFPPVADSQSIRNAYFVRALVGAGCGVTVLTGPVDGGDATLAELLPSGVIVKRTGFCHYDRIQRWTSWLPSRFLRDWGKSAVALFAGKLLAPDVRPDWKSRASREANRLIEEQNFDVVVSSSGIFAAHEVAGDLAQRHALTWVAEYGDPWALNPLPPLSLPHIRDKNLILEKRLLTLCSGMTVTTEETAQLYRNWLGSACPPIEVVSCGFTRLGVARSKPKGEWLVSYVGTAGRGNRDLRDFMALLDAMLEANPSWKIKLRVVGSYSPAFVSFASQLAHLETEFVRWVPYMESVRLMEVSDVLLLYGNSAPIQVPGKLFNYLATGRPVLYFGKLAPSVDPCLSYLAQRGGVRRFGSDAPASVDALAELFRGYAEWEREASVSLAEPDFARKFAWNEVSARFATFVLKTAMSCKK